MPINSELATKTYYRYAWVRDAGHSDYVKKAELCERFFRGMQWDERDLALLQAQKRPALTINKVLSTISNVMGDQIYNRSEISFQPRSGATSDNADTLTKLFKYISQDNNLDWVRSDVFSDGIITSRGFFDVRMDFNDNLMGDVRIKRINPKNVIIDPDADEYNPDTWNDVFITKWLTADEIAILYNEDDAEYLRNRAGSFFPYGYDSIDFVRDRFAGRMHSNSYYLGVVDESSVMRSIRVLERQHRKLDNQKHFFDPSTGDTRAVPDSWSRDKIAAVKDQFKLDVINRLVTRIRWTVTADNCVLHDDWSPYKHLTVVPYFPYLRHGHTVGLVENLLGPQEMLNKVSSQELHVINTTANSGWKVKTGAMRNMSIEELEQRGAETGLVVELDDPDSLQKITPNQVPSGLDRLTYKAEEHIKSISGVSDYMTGQAREDVSAKAVAMNQNRGSFNLAKVTDSLNRTDHILATAILDLVQEYYTDPRLINVMHDRMTGGVETVGVNQVNPESGEILNDLTLGEYDVIVTSTPVRETLEDSQFQQALSLREMGIPIPDSTLLENSRLMHKSDIIKSMQEASQTPEAQAKQEMDRVTAQLQVSQLKAEAARLEADAMLKQAKAQKEQIATQQSINSPDPEAMRAQEEMEMARDKHVMELEKLRAELEFKQAEMELKRRELEQKIEFENKKQALDMALKQAEAYMNTDTSNTQE